MSRVRRRRLGGCRWTNSSATCSPSRTWRRRCRPKHKKWAQTTPNDRRLTPQISALTYGFIRLLYLRHSSSKRRTSSRGNKRITRCRSRSENKAPVTMTMNRKVEIVTHSSQILSNWSVSSTSLQSYRRFQLPTSRKLSQKATRSRWTWRQQMSFLTYRCWWNRHTRKYPLTTSLALKSSSSSAQPSSCRSNRSPSLDLTLPTFAFQRVLWQRRTNKATMVWKVAEGSPLVILAPSTIKSQ